MKLALVFLGIAAAALITPAVQATAPQLEAQLTCASVTRPGRILCELTAAAPSGKLVWSDLLVVRAPSFARPLQSRVLAQLGAADHHASSAKFALVATEAGQGELQVLARAVVCHPGATGEWCDAEAVRVSASLSVAPPTP